MFDFSFLFSFFEYFHSRASQHEGLSLSRLGLLVSINIHTFTYIHTPLSRAVSFNHIHTYISYTSLRSGQFQSHTYIHIIHQSQERSVSINISHSRKYIHYSQKRSFSIIIHTYTDIDTYTTLRSHQLHQSTYTHTQT